MNTSNVTNTKCNRVTKSMNFELDPATRAVGFSVAFRDIDGSSWRKVEVIEEKSEYYIKLKLEGSELISDNTRGIEQVYF